MYEAIYYRQKYINIILQLIFLYMTHIQLDDHIMNGCNWVKCPCSTGKDMLFEVSSYDYPDLVFMCVHFIIEIESK